jgi:hypothetical protein
VPGSDRPGVMGARLVARLVGRDGVLPGERVLLVGEGEELDAVRGALSRAGAEVVGPVPTLALRAIGGRVSVAWVRFLDPGGTPRRERVDAVAFGDRTPNLDLVLAAGGRVGWRDGRLTPLVDPDGQTSVPGLFVAGDAAGHEGDLGDAAADALARTVGRAASGFARSSTRIGEATAPETGRAGDPPRSTSDGTPAGRGSAHAVLCFCEDVRGWEIDAELTAGYEDPELVKRRTGALTGPCQGKYCLSAVTCALNGANSLATAAGAGGIVLPTGRPPLRPIRLGDLVADEAVPTTPDPGPPAASVTVSGPPRR